MDNGLFPYTSATSARCATHFSTVGVNGVNEMIRTSAATNTTSPLHGATTSRCGCSITSVDASPRSRKRPATCTTWRPRRPRAPPTASPRRMPALPASCRRQRRGAVLHQLDAAAGGLHRRRLRGAGTAGRPAAQYTGGTVLHLYMSERISSVDACRNLVRRALTRFPSALHHHHADLFHLPKHGYLAGEHEFCPTCDEEALSRKRAVQPDP